MSTGRRDLVDRTIKIRQLSTERGSGVDKAHHKECMSTEMKHSVDMFLSGGAYHNLMAVHDPLWLWTAMRLWYAPPDRNMSTECFISVDMHSL